MSKLALYTGLKTRLQAVDGVEYVGLWNNQPANERKEHPYRYPAVFIEFLPSDYVNFLQGVQKYSMIVRLHICFSSLADDDTSIMTLQRNVAIAMRYAQYSYFNKLSLIGKEQNFDHDGVQIYTQDYRTSGKDYGADNRPSDSVTLSLNAGVEFVDALEDAVVDDDTEEASSDLILFNNLKATLETIPNLHVALWNNQPNKEKQEHPFNYPACFIEIRPSENEDFLQAAQRVRMSVRLHICFESYKDEDTAILTLVDTVFNKVHMKQYGNFTKLLRTNEEQDFNHDQVQIYTQDYATMCKEYQPATTTPITLSPTFEADYSQQIGVLETEFGPDILLENGDNILL